jgi:Cu/Zn superoxide dismutase
MARRGIRARLAHPREGRLQLTGLGGGGANNLVGKAVVVHAKMDDYKTPPFRQLRRPHRMRRHSMS